MGMAYLTLTPDEFESIQAWQDETGIQVIYPAITDTRQSDANIWYEANRKGVATLDDEGNFQPIYKTTTPTDTTYHSLRIAADNDPERPPGLRPGGRHLLRAQLCGARVQVHVFPVPLRL